MSLTRSKFEVTLIVNCDNLMEGFRGDGVYSTMECELIITLDDKIYTSTSTVDIEINQQFFPEGCLEHHQPK